jgi:hypothetical protein
MELQRDGALSAGQELKELEIKAHGMTYDRITEKISVIRRFFSNSVKLKEKISANLLKNGEYGFIGEFHRR